MPTLKSKSLFLGLAVVLLAAACHQDQSSPLGPGAETDNNPPAAPVLIPLAPGASWNYTLNYKFEWIKYGCLGYEKDHYGSFLLAVAEADTVHKNFILHCRLTLDSLHCRSVTWSTYPNVTQDTAYTLITGRDALPVSPDTSYTLQIVTRNDTAFYDLESGLRYFMPWSVGELDHLRLDLWIMAYPREKYLGYTAELIRGSSGSWWTTHGLSGMVPYGGLEGSLTPDSRGVTAFRTFYSPGLISDHPEEYLTYTLQEYFPGASAE